MNEVMVVRRSRWQWWRDAVIALLTAAVFLLIHQVGILSQQYAAATNARVRDLAALTDQLDLLRQQRAVDAARIKQLTDQLLAAGITPVAAPSPTPQAQPRPSPSVTADRPPHPTPSRSVSPTPHRSGGPSPRPSPSPSPSTCLPVASQVCLPLPVPTPSLLGGLLP